MALIYVVEDDKNIQEIETFALAGAGYQTVGFSDAASFYKGVAEKMPDLILMDVMLPDEDGLSIVHRLRSDKETERIPIIMVTAKTTEPFRQRTSILVVLLVLLAKGLLLRTVPTMEL